MRKIISLIVALAFLFSIAAPAMAATPSDAEKAGNRLLSLGVIEGYTDGTLGLDKQITRAEIAVILAKASGLKDAADLLKDTPSKFSDVKVGEWYTGWINLAAAQGWVKGDPQGTFRPNDPVSYREIVTMLLKILGYNDNLPGDWPVDYLVKAAALGITKDVAFDAKAPAVRGDVFRFTAKTLENNVVTYDIYTDVFSEGILPKTLMESKLDVAVVKGRVSDVPGLLGSSLKDDEITIIGQAEYNKVVEGFDVNQYIGLEVEFYANKDKEVFAVKSTDADQIKSDKVDGSITVNGSVYEVTLKDAGKTYKINSDSIVIKDFTKVAWNSVAGNDGASVKLIADSNNVVKFIQITDWDHVARGIVKSVDKDAKEIEYKDSVGSIKTNYDDEDYNVIVMGAVDSFDKIRENDLVYDFNDGSNDYILYVVRDTVSGKVTKVNSNSTEVYLDGKKYTAALDFYSDDNSKEFSFTPSDAARDYLGKDVVAYLNPQGEIVGLAAAIKASNATTALALSELTRETSLGVTTYWIKLFTAEGTKAVYKLVDGDVKVNNTKASELVFVYNATTGLQGKLVGFDLNEDGKITSMATKEAKGEAVSINPASDDVKKYNRLTGTDGAYWYVTNSTVIINADRDDYKDPSILTWASVKDASSIVEDVYFYGSDNKISYIVLASDIAVGDDDKYVVFVSDFYNIDNKPTISVFENGAVVDYVYEGYTLGSLSEKDVITYNLKNGKIDSAVKKNLTASDKAIAAINSDLQLITVEENQYLVNADTVIVDYSNTNPKAATFASLRKGQRVNLVAGDDKIADIIVILQK